MDGSNKKFENATDTDPSAEPIKVEWGQTGVHGEIPRVLLHCGESYYSATLVDGVFYGEMLKVLPKENRRTGTGTRLLHKLVEVAREKGVKTIIHGAISTEGLQIIRNKLPMPERTYHDVHRDRWISFEEACDLLRKKGKANERTNVLIYTFTEVDQIVNTGT